MPMLLSKCAQREDTETTPGLAVQFRSLGAEAGVCLSPDYVELLLGLGVPLVQIGVRQ